MDVCKKADELHFYCSSIFSRSRWLFVSCSIFARKKKLKRRPHVEQKIKPVFLSYLFIHQMITIVHKKATM